MPWNYRETLQRMIAGVNGRETERSPPE